MKIYVVRHGQTEWNVQKRVMGRHDVSLNDEGLKDAYNARLNLLDKDLDLIIASPLKRTR